MRSNIICSFAAVFAAFMQFSAIFAAFALPGPATAEQPAGAIATVSVTREQGVREVAEVVVEVRRAI
jgi:hypothetical protein